MPTWDVVHALSMEMIRDLRRIIVTLKDSLNLLEESRRKILASVFNEPTSPEDEKYLFHVLSRFRSEMRAEKLVPLGLVLMITFEEHFL